MNGTLWLLVVLWMMPLAQELSEPDGNLTQLWMFFGGGEARPGQPWRTSFRIWADMISAMVRSDVHVGWGNRYGPKPNPWNQGWAIAETAAVVVIAVRAVLARDSFRAALATMTLIASGVGLWSIMQIDDDIYDHLVFWLVGIGVLQVGLIADALVRLVPRADRVLTPRLTASVCVLLLGIAAAEGFQGLRVIVSRSFRPGIEQLSARRLADAIMPAFADNRVKRPLVTIDQPVWGIAAGVLLQLQKRHIPFSVEEGWWFMFGAPARPAGNHADDDRLIFAGPELRIRLNGQFRRGGAGRARSHLDSARALSALSRLGAPVFQQIVQRAFEGDFRRPAKLRPDARRVADDQGLIVRTVPCGIGHDADRHACAREQHVENIADGHRPARADVVGAPGPAASAIA